MNSKEELFNKITRNKQLNQSQCDTMRNINIRSLIICRVVNERTKLFTEEDLIVLDDYFKCKWYNEYQKYSISELVDMYRDILKKYIDLTNHVKVRSRYIAKLRTEMNNKFKKKRDF